MESVVISQKERVKLRTESRIIVIESIVISKKEEVKLKTESNLFKKLLHIFIYPALETYSLSSCRAMHLCTNFVHAKFIKGGGGKA